MSDFLLTVADFVGILAFALAGILACAGKKVDPVGVFVMAFTTAFGGGILRDIIIDARPFYWVAHTEYVWMVLGLSFIAPALLRKFSEHQAYTVFVWLDAVGLGFFCTGGTLLSLTMGMPALPAVLLGVCTGIFGGLIRDVFLNKLPMVLSDSQPYASAGFLGSWLLLGLVRLDIGDTTAIWISSVVIVAVRMFCWYKQLNIIAYSKSLLSFRIGARKSGKKSPVK